MTKKPIWVIEWEYGTDQWEFFAAFATRVEARREKEIAVLSNPADKFRILRIVRKRPLSARARGNRKGKR